MVTLKCDAMSCIYNDDHYCCKGNILVEGREAETKAGTWCSSFHERDTENYQNHTGEPESAILVDCEACNCVHNEKCVCQADRIDIRGNHATVSNETECDAFRCKSNCK